MRHTRFETQKLTERVVDHKRYSMHQSEIGKIMTESRIPTHLKLSQRLGDSFVGSQSLESGEGHIDSKSIPI